MNDEGTKSGFIKILRKVRQIAADLLPHSSRTLLLVVSLFIAIILSCQSAEQPSRDTSAPPEQPAEQPEMNAAPSDLPAEDDPQIIPRTGDQPLNTGKPKTDAKTPERAKTPSPATNSGTASNAAAPPTPRATPKVASTPKTTRPEQIIPRPQPPPSSANSSPKGETKEPERPKPPG